MYSTALSSAPHSTADEFLDDILGFGTNAPDNPPPSFEDFKRRIWRNYQPARHIDLINEYLEQVIRYVETEGREGIGFLILTMPPRHGKSINLGRFFPAYVVGRHPDWRVIYASYAAHLAHKFSRQARNLLLSPVYQEMFPGVELARDGRAADSWNIADHEGGEDAMGVGGGVTGKGGHILIGDDLLSGREDAESETIREKVWDWFTDDFYTRIDADFAARIITHTRWHQDDPIGRILRNQPGKWTVLNLPALAEASDPLGRAEGEALWAERFSVRVLRDIEVTQGEYSFSALYQQNPVPAEGGIFKRAWFTPAMQDAPPIAYAVRYWDLAMSEKTTADYTAGVKYGMGEDGHRYVLDVVHERIDWGDLTERMAQVMLADGADVAQGIEEKGYMSRAIQALNVDPRLHGYQVWGYPADRDKLTRALPAAAKAASGVVHVLNRHWTERLLDELCSFPYGTHDDQVDAFAGAEAMLGDQLGAAVGGLNINDSNAISQSDY